MMNSQQSEALRGLVKSAVEAHVKSGLELASVLAQVYTGTVETRAGEIPLVEHWGHEDFHSYAEHELGMHGGNALRYVRIHEELVTKYALKDLPQSITKLGELARVAKLEPSDLKSWIAKSHKLSCCELQHEISRKYGFGDGKRIISFELKYSQSHQLQKKVKAAQERLRAHTMGEALLAIVQQWEAEQSNVVKLPSKKKLRKAG